jgi:hypothetical protein
MTPTLKRLLIVTVGVGIVGAVLAFALKNSDASAVGVDLQAFGLVLLASAFVVALIAIASVFGSAIGAKEKKGQEGAVHTGSAASAGEKTDIESLKIVTGLAAVIAGVVSVAALTVVAASLISDDQSTVAITTSALGIISTVVTAYLGIKATANTSSKANEVATELVKKIPNS